MVSIKDFVIKSLGGVSREELILNADSKGVMLDYSGLGNSRGQLGRDFGQTARVPINKINNVIRQEPTVKTAALTLVDKAMEGGWTILGQSSGDERASTVDLLREQKANKLIRQILFNLIFYNNAYVEVVGRGRDAKFNLLEAAYIRPVAADNGDILYYEQEVGGKQKPITWEVDEVAHFEIDSYNTSVWSEQNLEAIYEVILIKDAIRAWLKWFFQTNQLRPVIGLKTGTKADVQDLISMIKASKDHIDMPLLVKGEVVVMFLQDFAEQGKSVLDVLNWCNEEIYRLLQTPPISIGQPNESGRSDGAEQRGTLYTRVIALQAAVNEGMDDLFQKAGLTKSRFVFKAMDDKVVKNVFETVQIMKNSMFTDEAIKEYLESQGVYFHSDELFKDPVEMANAMSNKGVGTGNEGMIGNKSADAAPSRQRQSQDTLSKGNQGVQSK